jgi:hypothetical protein
MASLVMVLASLFLWTSIARNPLEAQLLTLGSYMVNFFLTIFRSMYCPEVNPLGSQSD